MGDETRGLRKPLNHRLPGGSRTRQEPHPCSQSSLEPPEIRVRLEKPLIGAPVAAVVVPATCKGLLAPATAFGYLTFNI